MGTPRLYSYVGVDILSVMLRLIPVLNCKFGAAVKASETHNTLILYPDRFSVRDSDDIHRALLLAQAAAYTAVLYTEIRSFACFVIIDRARNHLCDKSRRSRRHMRVYMTLRDIPTDIINALFCRLCKCRNLFGR